MNNETTLVPSEIKKTRLDLKESSGSSVATQVFVTKIVSPDGSLAVRSPGNTTLTIAQTSSTTVLASKPGEKLVLQSALVLPPTETAGVFITDVTSTGVVGKKIFTPDGKVLLSCSSDTDVVRVHVGSEGIAGTYTPSVVVNGVNAVMAETSTKRWFEGYADITIGFGDTLVGASTVFGVSNTVTVTRAAEGPQITSLVWGSYPGSQTSLKMGDQIGFTVYSDNTASTVTITGGIATNTTVVNAINGVATGTLTVGSGSGPLSVSVSARNDFGTKGNTITSPTLLLDQVAPSFGTATVSYPAGQGALGIGDSGSVACTVTNADSVAYSSPSLLISAGYQATKSVTNPATGVTLSGTNYHMVATKLSNGAVTTKDVLVKVTTVAPTAAITIVSSGRLVSSPSGIDYEVRITPDQTLSAAPSLTASAGAWQGSWTLVGSYWSRLLRVVDAVPRGAATFSALSMSGLSLLSGSTISSGAAYVVGGMSSRTLTFAAFSRVAALGAAVLDQTKTSASIVGGNTLTRQGSNAVVANGFYIANADGTYNANGSYIGLSDTGLVGANTSGTLQVTFAEVA